MDAVRHGNCQLFRHFHCEGDAGVDAFRSASPVQRRWCLCHEVAADSWRETTLPHAIIRGKNGRRHEVDFGDAQVRVEIYASEETVEIFIGADFETLRRRVGASPFSAFPATCSAKPPPQRRDVQRSPALR